MEIKDPKAEYRRLVKMEIEMRKMHKAAIYDQIFNADTINKAHFGGYLRALESALKMTPEEVITVTGKVRAEGLDE